MSDVGSGEWVTAPDGTHVWKQPDGSLWRQAPDGTWVALPPQPSPGLPPRTEVLAQLRRLDAPRWALVAGLVLSGVGVLLPWVTAVFISVSGLDTSDGKLFGGVVLVGALFAVLRIRTQRLAFGVLALLACLALAGIAIYEVVNILAAPEGPFEISASPGSGLYLDVVASLVASVGIVLELRGRSSRGAATPAHAPSRRAVVITIVTVVALVGGGITTAVVATSGPDAPGPDSVVQGYLTALSDGDAAGALKLGPKPPSRTFLTHDILVKQQAVSKIRNVKLGDVDVFGDDASVPVTYMFGSKSVDTDFSLRKTSGHWKLTATVVSVDVGDISSLPELTLYGKPVTRSTIDVFPGPLQFASGDPDFGITNDQADDFATDPDDYSYVSLEASLSASGKKRVETAIRTKLTACSKVKTLEPSDCPQSDYPYGDVVPGSVVWKLTGDMHDVDYEIDYETPTLVDVSGETDWSVTYRYKDWDDTVATSHDEAVGYIDGTVDLTQPTAVLTLS
jgi:hypothetical protein